MSYYIKGGSNYDTGAQAKLWAILHLAGYPSGHFSDTTWKDISKSGAVGDPFWSLGGNGGDEQAEFGLYSGTRLKFTSGNAKLWDTTSGAWIDITGGAGDNLGNHTGTMDLNMNGYDIVNANKVYKAVWN